MDPEAVQTQEAPLTVNEQVIVMSSHETIRVLEVGVDAPPPAEEDGKPLEMPPGEGAQGSPRGSGDPGREDVPPSAETSCSAEAAGKTKPAAGASPSSVPPGGTFGHAASQQPQPLAPLAAPQVLTQENLATVVTGVMVPAGTVTQPLLIPISIAGQVAGQQGLAVWTFPTATVAALPGLTAASPTGGIFKPPIANLQAAAVLNTAIPAPVQPAQPLPAAVQPRPPLQPQSVFPPAPAVPSQPPILPQPAAAPTPPVAKPLEPQTQIAVQPAGFAFNPGIISAASLGGQTQLLSSLAAAPVIANTISSVQGITGQILTNAQGQVIGTLPWVVNPPGIAAASPVPAPNLQVQAVTPQLLLNAQGQVIATLASGTIQAATIKKSGPPEPPTKSEVQPIQPAPALPQPAVVIANPAPAAKAASAPVPITCSETPTVSQLVASEAPGPQQRRGGGRHQPGGDPGVRQELQDPAPVPRPDADPGGAGPDGYRGPCLQPVGHLQVREARHHPQERPEAEAGAGEVAERGRAAQPGGAAEPDGVRGRRALQEAQAPDVFHAAGHRGAQRLLREERAAHRPGDHRDRQGAQLRPRSRPRVVLQPPTDAQKHQQTQRLSDPLRKGAGGAPHAQTPSPSTPPRPSLLPSALCDRLSPAPAPLPGSSGGLGSPPNRARRCPCPPPTPHVAQPCSHPVSRVPRRPVTCVVPDPRLHSPCLPTPPG